MEKEKSLSIEKNKCPKCGKEKDREGYYCSECLEKKKQNAKDDYWGFKMMRICVRCHKNTVYGFETSCPECKAEIANWFDKKKIDPAYRAKRYKSANDAKKKTYRLRKTYGLCIQCGKRPSMENRVRCSICLSKARETARVNRSIKKITVRVNDESKITGISNRA